MGYDSRYACRTDFLEGSLQNGLTRSVTGVLLSI